MIDQKEYENVQWKLSDVKSNVKKKTKKFNVI